MSFVYPNFLWALLLLIIPIIIHLFNFRKYKTVFFSKVSFLNEIVEDSKSGNRLKELLILLSRLLAIAALVIAFAQPFIPIEGQENTENISSIYIDNSFSMQAQGKDGDLLNEAKNKAIELVKSFDENEKINLLTSELLAKDQRFYSKSEIIERIKEIDFSPINSTLNTVLNLQTDLLSQNANKSNKRLFIFSDFQSSTNQLTDFSKAEVPTFYYQPKAELKGNIYIDSVWFESPVQRLNTPIEIFFRVVNLSEEPVSDLNVTLALNEQEKGWKKINIQPNAFVDESISFTNTSAGLKKGRLHIETNQLFFDDDFFFTYNINEKVNILLVNGGQVNHNIEQLYALSDFYNANAVNINQVKQEDFRDKQLIILQNVNEIPSGVKNLLQEALKNGSSIALMPGANANKQNWNSFLSQLNLPTLVTQFNPQSDLNYFNSEDPIYYGVFEKDPKNYKYAKVFKTYNLN
ncbi:MAG: vWA domain-containing protein, partial [Putridiphycobacter sp.]